MTTAYRVRKPVKFGIGLITYLLALLVCLSSWGDALNLFLSDFLFQVRGRTESPGEIVIVAIDEPSFGVLQQQWPWPRSVHARLIDRLFQAGARVVAFDVIFAEPSIPDEDIELTRALAAHPRTVLAADFHVVNEREYFQEILVMPHPDLLPPSSPVGFVTLPVDPDGFVRRIHPSRGPLETLALVAARFCAGSDRAVDVAHLSADTNWGEMEINFLGPSRTVRTVSYYQALEPEVHLPAGFFRDKLVFVGLVVGTAIEGRSRGQENFPVPFSRWGGGYMAGVEIHAQAAHNFLHNTLIRRLPVGTVLPVGLLVGVPLSLLCLSFRPLRGAFLMAVGGIVLLSFAAWLFISRLVVLPLVVCAVPAVSCYLVSPFLHYWEVWKEKDFIRKAFSTYLAPSVVGQLLGSPDQLRLGGELVEASVLFLDVAGFTTLSEKTRPEELIQVLNRYLGAFTEIVFRWGGMVDKFIGDAVMATWGVPVGQPEHAERACRAALEMREMMAVLGAQEEAMGTGLRLRIRIGINSGEMIAGNVGGERHFNYTVLGDEVNLASRLEGVNRHYGTVITIGQNTARRVEGRFELRELDYVRVKGKAEAVRIFELQACAGDLSELQRMSNDLFGEGRRLYDQRRWGEARALFERGDQALPEGDGPCRCFAERCRAFELSPPGGDWDCAVPLEK